MARVVVTGMTPMWASFRPDARSSGFTLLEVLVVLVIISMAVAVIGPRLQRTYDAVVTSGQRQDVIRQLERLPIIARSSQGLDLVAGSNGLNDRLELPDGWSVYPLQPLRVEASGACHSSQLRLQRADESGAEQVKLREPDCVIVEL